MFTLRKRFRFEASHRLPHHDGKCARLHGHSWNGWVEVQSDMLVASGPERGMVMDFYRIGDPLKALVEAHLDHYHLNESTGLENPTSEGIARWMFDWLFAAGVPVTAVCIEETCTSSCEYRP